jgi:hypothetical protein
VNATRANAGHVGMERRSHAPTVTSAASVANPGPGALAGSVAAGSAIDSSDALVKRLRPCPLG